ncbi:hypothetical protein ACBP83_07175 [Acinetobacter pseudolwoffii]|uniref:hypothetical protein n=1 Tax=Acinetobacter pseudolwoffii TaxID=2053287 RepID=UPI0035269B6C
MADIQALYDEFEEFCTKYCGLAFDEFSIYQRKKLGRYFDVRDEYFRLWLNAKRVYSKDATNATSHIP